MSGDGIYSAECINPDAGKNKPRFFVMYSHADGTGVNEAQAERLIKNAKELLSDWDVLCNQCTYTKSCPFQLLAHATAMEVMQTLNGGNAVAYLDE